MRDQINATSPTYMQKNLYIASILLLAMTSAYSQCTKDNECKGDRICEKGICVAPGTFVPSRITLTAPKNSTQGALSIATPRFEEFISSKYSGPVVIPKGTKRISANEWRNDMGKMIEPPVINFAGKYNITLNSCGTGCRYYSLTDLSNGKSLPALSVFTAAEPPPTTKEGYTYITDLIGRPGSYMLVAQYQVDNPKGQECRERTFAFENEVLKPITNTKVGCSVF